MNGDNGAAAARMARFAGSKETENRYELLKAKREAERRAAIKDGLIPDPNRRTTLEEAFNLVGTCEDMCPEFEREQREYQRAVDKWEIDPSTNRIDPRRAVKTFHRPAAGDETPLPSDVRPPHSLKSTLDYLIHDLLAANSLEATHNFIRDRTRSIRQDFTLQHESGPLAIECHERIARLHILSLHEMRGVKDYTQHLEMEQVRKVLQSLMEFYDDAPQNGIPTPNEAEFRAYHLIAHIRDPEVARQLERQSALILDDPVVQVALDIHAVAQRNNIAKSRRAANTEAAQNLASRFFALTSRPSTPFLLSCILEFHFDDVRKGALKAMRASFREMHKAYPIDTLTEMLGFDDDLDTATFVQACALEVQLDPASRLPIAAKVHNRAIFDESAAIPVTKSNRLVSSKKGFLSDAHIIDGQKPFSIPTPAVPPSPVMKRALSLSRPVERPTDIFSSSPIPPFVPGPSSDSFTSRSISVENPNPPAPPLFPPAPSGNAEFPHHRPTPSPSPFAGLSFGPQSIPAVRKMHFTPFQAPIQPAYSSAAAPSSSTSSLEFSAPSTSTLTIPPFAPRAESQSTDPPIKLLDSSVSRPSRASSIAPDLPAATSAVSRSTLSNKPVSSPRPRIRDEAEEARSAKVSQEALILQLTQSTFDTMVSSLVTLQHWDAVAEEQRRRSLLRLTFSRWMDRLIDIVQAREVARKSRLALREVVQRARWDMSDNESLHSESFLDPRKLRQPIVDDFHVKSLEVSSAKRAGLWERGTFFNIVRSRLKNLRRSLPARWQIWLSTANSSDKDPTAQWLHCKLGIEHAPSHFDETLGALSTRNVDEKNEVVLSPSRPAILSPGLILFEVSRTLSPQNIETAWGKELVRLKSVLALSSCESGYVPVLVFLFWIRHEFALEEFHATVVSKVSHALQDDPAVIERVRQIRFVLLSSSSTAEDSFATIIESVKFDLIGKFAVSDPIIIEDEIEPYAKAWNKTLRGGMSIVATDGNVSWKAYTLLFQRLVHSLNRMILSVWNGVFNADEDSISHLRLPEFDPQGDTSTASDLYAALLTYFGTSAFDSHPVVEVFKAELRDNSNFAPSSLLASLLQRLGDAVVFEMIVSAESTASLARRPPSSLLTQFELHLQSVLRDLPSIRTSALANANNVRDYVEAGRKRSWTEDEERTPASAAAKRSRPSSATPSPLSNGVNHVPSTTVTPSSLLLAIRAAREKHGLPTSNEGRLSVG